METGTDIIPISKDYKVEIEVQSGLGYTREGQKQSAQQLGDYLIQLAQIGMVPPNVMTAYIEKLFETYQFGMGSEVAKELDNWADEGQITDQQMEKIKVAIAEVIQESGLGEAIQKKTGAEEQAELGEAKVNAMAEVMGGGQGGEPR